MRFTNTVEATKGEGSEKTGPDATVDDARMKARLAASYQPMLRALLFPFAAYFVIVTIAYLLIEEPVGQILLGTSSLIVAAASFAMWAAVSRRALGYREIELYSFTVFLLVSLNTLSHQLLHLEPAKLFFFTLIILATAVVGISARLVAVACATCSAAMLFLAAQVSTELLLHHVFVALAASFVAFMMSGLTRRTIIREITARLSAEELRGKAEQMAARDMLTELPNRRSFFQALEKMFKRRQSVEPSFTVAVVDLDGFKVLNDTFGHAVGDQFLIETAQRLKSMCNENKFVARLSGDEFAIIIDGARDTETLRRLGERIRAELRKPLMVHSIRVTAEASVVFVSEDINIFTASEMIERADFAMKHAKSEKSGVVVFSPELEGARRETAAIVHNLRHCDREAEMSVVFQPQIDLATERTVGFEALGRWNNRELGPVRPDIFIRAAERTGVIQELSAHFLTKALAAAKHWPDDVKLSFNLSIRDIDTQPAVENIRRIVVQSGFPPERIEFEVTETLMMTDFDQAQRSLMLLQDLGSRVALDDFGVGYANFGHIDQLNINTIKIDRSFVSRLCDRGNSGKIIKTMIDMCANLKVGCVVEGVETAEELAVLKRMGASCVQGFYFSKPIAPEEIAAHFARELSRRVAEPAAQAEKTG